MDHADHDDEVDKSDQTVELSIRLTLHRSAFSAFASVLVLRNSGDDSRDGRDQEDHSSRLNNGINLFDDRCELSNS